jgi:hypothetical protein
VLLSEQEWPSVERERVVSEEEDIDDIICLKLQKF